MPDPTVLFNFLITQKSITEEMPYDLIEKVIQDSVSYVKANHINARIANLALSINNQLVLAQVYVERKNGFSPSKDQRYGTTPTAFNVQIRFPFGLETRLGEQSVLLPAGDFHKPLSAYYSATKVSDDVQRDYQPEDIILGPGVVRNVIGGVLHLSCESGAAIAFPVREDIGKGYAVIFTGVTEYYYLSDYNLRLKMAGVSPLFDSQAGQTSLLRKHDYRGYTDYNDNDKESVTEGPAGASERVADYENFLRQGENSILRSATGQAWQQRVLQRQTTEPWVFDIEIINGTVLHSQTGLPLSRLRDYQLELFAHCLDFIDAANTANQNQGQHTGLAGTINMGVGAGKTFFTFTLLQHLAYSMKHSALPVTPPYCLAPDAAVAEVSERAINRQGAMTAISAMAITDVNQIPDAVFMDHYEQIISVATQHAAEVDEYLNRGLQDTIRRFCRERALHPYQMSDLIYSVFQYHEQISRMQTFKDSIDAKRLLLMVEGQKTIIDKTGQLAFTALKNLHEQFTAIQEEIEKQKQVTPEKIAALARETAEERERVLKQGLNPVTISQTPGTELYKRIERCTNLRRSVTPLFKDYISACSASQSSSPIDIDIDYNQEVVLPFSCRGPNLPDRVRVTQLTEAQLLALLTNKHKTQRVAIRDDLASIAGFDTHESAIILANWGGLGSSKTAEEIEEQISYLLPFAWNQLISLAKKTDKNNSEHFRLYMSLNKLFSTLPEQFTPLLGLNRAMLYRQNLQHHVELINQINCELDQFMSRLATVDQMGIDPHFLAKFGISPNATAIEAAHKLAAAASLQVTGFAQGSNANLLLSHIPVFTPEGLACYFEHLARLPGQVKYTFEAHHGVYGARPDGMVSNEDITARLQQILSAIMVADEIHKDEFKFLYDSKNEIYQRINAVTMAYLGREFKDVLPHRIGMSGTMTKVAEKAFKGPTLYKLSTQKMMQQGLMKQVSVDTGRLDMVDKGAYARQIVADYFTHSSTLSLNNVLTGGSLAAVDLSALSKGLLFSRHPDPELQHQLQHYFNLLISEEPSDAQVALFAQINQQREQRVLLLQGKLAGNVDLTAEEVKQTERYNRKASSPVVVEGHRIRNGGAALLELSALNPQTLQACQRNAFQNIMFAFYLEYILSKSNTPKELSDIIGLQNRLFEKGHQLTDISRLQQEAEISMLLASINSVDPRTITLEDAEHFVKERVKSEEQAELLIGLIMSHTNKHVAFVDQLIEASRGLKSEHFITRSRVELESGSAMAMLGTEKERTGYSYEPVGIVLDIPANLENHQRLNFYLTQIDSLDADGVTGLLACLQSLVHDSLSYDEKNQAGGRALRTPYGHVRYIEYQTDLNALISSRPHLAALQMETSFADIFIDDEARAKEVRDSTLFNREALRLLAKDHDSDAAFYDSVARRFRKELNDPGSVQRFRNYIDTRLSLFWNMKHQPVLAAAYLAGVVSHGAETALSIPPTEAITRVDLPPYGDEKPGSTETQGLVLQPAEEASESAPKRGKHVTFAPVPEQVFPLSPSGRKRAPAIPVKEYVRFTYNYGHQGQKNRKGHDASYNGVDLILADTPQLSRLTGDHLKRAILCGLKDKINLAVAYNNKSVLDQIKSSGEYRILARRQNPTFSFFHRKTTSQKELDKMLAKAERILLSIKPTASPG